LVLESLAYWVERRKFMERRKDFRRDLFSRRDFLKISGLSGGALAISSLNNIPLSFAKDVFPSDRVTFIVPQKPGGGYDIYARGISPYISKYLKETPGAKGGEVVVKNEAGAAGHKGYAMIFNGKPDGYTIGLIETSIITDNIVDKPEFDFTKLTILAVGYYTTKMIVTSKKGFNSWNEVMSAMEKQPVKMAAGNFGRANHVSCIIMNEKMGTKFKLINFPGTAECVNAVLRGDVHVAIITEDAAAALVEGGELKVLLRFTEVSDYPGAVSLKELGCPELVDYFMTQRFIAAPPGLAVEPRNILMETIKKATNDKDFAAWAKKVRFNLRNISGGEAQQVFLRFIKFYEDLTPILKKYIT
jgi:tripartite-type tricarboxylate transporter receptor subunit TctC